MTDTTDASPDADPSGPPVDEAVDAPVPYTLTQLGDIVLGLLSARVATDWEGTPRDTVTGETWPTADAILLGEPDTNEHDS